MTLRLSERAQRISNRMSDELALPERRSIAFLDSLVLPSQRANERPRPRIGAAIAARSGSASFGFACQSVVRCLLCSASIEPPPSSI